ncbi:hypothetical protein D3C81_1994700 [compost metagenome]
MQAAHDESHSVRSGPLSHLHMKLRDPGHTAQFALDEPDRFVVIDFLVTLVASQQRCPVIHFFHEIPDFKNRLGHRGSVINFRHFVLLRSDCRWRQPLVLRYDQKSVPAPAWHPRRGTTFR